MVSISAQVRDDFLIYDAVNEPQNKMYKGNISIQPITGHYTILVLVIGFPDRNTNWPVLENDDAYPLLGTFPNGKLLRDSVKERGGKLPIEEWIKPSAEHYLDYNSNGKFTIEINFPKPGNGKLFTTRKNFSEWATINKSDTNACANLWEDMLNDALENILAFDSKIFDNVSLVAIVFAGMNKHEYHKKYGGFAQRDQYDILDPLQPLEILYTGSIIHFRVFNGFTHEFLHNIGLVTDIHSSYYGLPDRNANHRPYNNTWGYDIMYNAGQLPSDNAMYGLPPMLTFDRIFLEWIEPDEVIDISNQDMANIKLADVNFQLSEEQKQNNIYRAARVFINDDPGTKEYFLLEYRNGSGYDKNLSNEFEQGIQSGILISHIKAKDDENNAQIDFKIAKPYNGWDGNPIPDDDYPRDYSRPEEWYKDLYGEPDYLDDLYVDETAENNVFFFIPDGGVHYWELTSEAPYIWDPNGQKYFFRLCPLKSNLYTDEFVQGAQRTFFNDTTRPSTQNFAGKKTHISIYNIHHKENLMLFDVKYNDRLLVENPPIIVDIDTVRLGNKLFPKVILQAELDSTLAYHSFFRRYSDNTKWFEWIHIGNVNTPEVSFIDTSIYDINPAYEYIQYFATSTDYKGFTSKPGELKVFYFSTIKNSQYNDTTHNPPIKEYQFSLSQNYPNPFNSHTTIEYSIAVDTYVEIILYNLLGIEIKKIFIGNRPAGNYKLVFESGRLSSGIYFIRMQAANHIFVRKTIVLK
ncbi:MAG: T9SS type A sorting domain-containing protein [bacterium]